MQSDTRRHLTTGYFLIAAFLLFSLPFGVPKAFVLWFTDPVGRVLAFLALVLFAPAAFFILTGMWAISVFIALIIVAVKILSWILQSLSDVSPVGSVVALLILVGLGWVSVKHLIKDETKRYLGEQFREVRGVGQRIVEFFSWLGRLLVEGAAWLSVAVGHNASEGETGINAEAEENDSDEGEFMAQSSALVSIHTAMVDMVRQHRELPVPPRAFVETQYDGWFLEAKKRFEMQNHRKTNEERLAILLQVNALQEAWFKIRRTEGLWQTFPEEEQNRRRKIEIERLELEEKMDGLKKKRDERSNPLSAEETKFVAAQGTRRLDTLDEVHVKMAQQTLTILEAAKQRAALEKQIRADSNLKEEEKKRAIEALYSNFDLLYSKDPEPSEPSHPSIYEEG